MQSSGEYQLRHNKELMSSHQKHCVFTNILNYKWQLLVIYQNDVQRYGKDLTICESIEVSVVTELIIQAHKDVQQTQDDIAAYQDKLQVIESNIEYTDFVKQLDSE